MIVLQIGQCGIQVGQSLFESLLSENVASDYVHYPFSLLSQIAIDTERKVWNKRSRLSNSTLFDPFYLDHGSSGRGNNWAHGYYDDSKIDEIMESYRKLVESSYSYDGCMLIHSLAGGTGSGLGSRLTQEIRETYGKNTIMTASFSPFITGETALQNYNSLLSLSVLQRNVDLIGFFPNDSLLASVTKHQSIKSHSDKIRKIHIETLNEYAVNCLLGQILPITPLADPTINLQRFNTLDFIYEMTPSPLHKFCLFASSNVSTNHQMDSWDDTLSNLLRNIPPEPNFIPSSVSSKLVLRGVIGLDVNKRLDQLTSRWQQRIGQSFIPSTNPNIVFSQLYGLNVKDCKRTAETCFNSNLILKYLSPIYDKSQSMYNQKAYLHWYNRYCTNDVSELFDDAFETVADVLTSYDL
ncbi:Tubulin/FtsZ family, GTPase domain-containing protein [Globomyces pollinis-pini]|nr:Tubulin/FtsZ family, GTPase domain-containing protein [Globomyces pollinis-pini]